MTTSPRPDDRDEILFAFNQSCPVPTAEQITEWCKRYPHFANDIREHAAISRDWDARQNKAEVPADKTMLERGFSRVLSLVFETDNAPATATSPKIQSFKEAAELRGTTVPKLEETLNVDRSILSALFNGRMLAPVGKRLVSAVCQQLQLTLAEFDELLRFALAKPRISQAKALEAPSVTPQTYEAIVHASQMTEERKKYWLEED